MSRLEIKLIQKNLKLGLYSTKPKQGRSEIWGSFSVVCDGSGDELEFVRCNTCPKILVYNGHKSGTSALWRHMSTEHNLPKFRGLDSKLDKPEEGVDGAECSRQVAEQLALRAEVECEIKDISHFVIESHKQACSDLEKASQFITEALQRELRRNMGLRRLIHRLEERVAGQGRRRRETDRASDRISEQTESSWQLKFQVEELQTRLKDKDNSLTQAKQTIAVLKNDLWDLRKKLQSHKSIHRTIPEVTARQQDEESLTNIVSEVSCVQQNVLVAVKEEVADDGYPCSMFEETDIPTEQITSSLADIKAELVQEEDEMSDMGPVISSVVSQSLPDPVKALRLSVQVVEFCSTVGLQGTSSKNNEYGETPVTGVTEKGPEVQIPKFTAVSETAVDNERPSYCGKGFPEKAAVREHKRDVHTEDEPKLEQDQQQQHSGRRTSRRHHKHYGKRVTTRANALAARKRTDTGQKRHQCKECGKCFRSLSVLTVHQRVHTGERPFQCGQCGKSFTQVGNLTMHNLIHTGQKPHQCTVCGSRFRHSGQLRWHQRNHTVDEPKPSPAILNSAILKVLASKM